ncbi:hypothetical protein ACP70R_042452 [Stipagrostis hirtigluma subsp. patula]
MTGTKRKTNEHSPGPAAAAVSIALVFDDDNLLIDILLRLGSPVWLVRAALVRRRWLRLASDYAFLGRFRGLHPPRILGLVVHGFDSSPRLLPVPQPPELAAAARLAGRTLESLGRHDSVSDCRNGRLLVEARSLGGLRYAVRSLLHAARPRSTTLPPPRHASLPEGLFRRSRVFLLEDEAASTSCLFLSIMCSKAKVYADFRILRSGVWSAPQSAVTELLQQEPHRTLFGLGDNLLSGSKVYMKTTAGAGCILGLDLATASFFIVELPDGAGCSGSLKFSRAHQSGLYVVGATGYQLQVWHGDGVEQWELVDTISVREACNHLNVQRWDADDGRGAPVSVVVLGDNAEFVILELVASGIVCCMQLSNRVVEKVVEGVSWSYAASLVPVTMVWPPSFPVTDRASEEH